MFDKLPEKEPFKMHPKWKTLSGQGYISMLRLLKGSRGNIPFGLLPRMQGSDTKRELGRRQAYTDVIGGMNPASKLKSIFGTGATRGFGLFGPGPNKPPPGRRTVHPRQFNLNRPGSSPPTAGGQFGILPNRRRRPRSPRRYGRIT